MATLLDQDQHPPQVMDEEIEDIYVDISIRHGLPEEVIVDADGTPPWIPTPSNRPAYILTAIGWLAILILTAYGLFFMLPAMTTITIVSRAQAVNTNATISLSAQLFPVIQKQESKIVLTTGHGHQPASRAHGYVTFYNAAVYPQSIQTGTILSGSSGVQVATDEMVTVPPGNLATNGRASISAHALAYGPGGNIAAGDIFGPCCKSLLQVVNSAFSGGQAARDYQAVAQEDIDGATASLTSQIGASIHIVGPPDETLIMPIPCSIQSMSSQPVGAEATSLTVSVQESCHPAAYTTSAFQQQASVVLASSAPAGMTRLGKMSIQNMRASLTDQTITLRAHLLGVFGYQYDSQSLARQLSGKSLQEATTLLFSQPGVSRIQIAGSLPRQANHLRFVVLYQEVQP